MVLVWQFHDCMRVQVQNDGECSEPFPNKWRNSRLSSGTNTVQHDVLCHFHTCCAGLWCWLANQTPFDGKLFNIRRVQAKSKVQTNLLDELPYADYMAKQSKKISNDQELIQSDPTSCLEKWLQTTPEDWNNKSIKWMYGDCFSRELMLNARIKEWSFTNMCQLWYKISTKQNGVLYQPTPGKPCNRMDKDCKCW